MLPRSFLRENRAQVLIVVLLGTATLLTLLTIGLLFQRGRTFMEDELKLRLKSVATVASMEFDGAVVDRIRGRKDMETPEFQDVVRKLRLLLTLTPGVNSTYIMRRTDDPAQLAFVADATSLDSPVELDTNGNGTVDPDEAAPLPGELYDVHNAPAMVDGFIRPTTDPEIMQDQWGRTISGYAPITRWDNGKTVALLGIDMSADEYLALSHGVFSTLLFLLIIIGASSIAGGVALLFLERRMHLLQRLERERLGLLVLASHQLGEPLTIFKYSVETLVDDIDSPQLKDAVREHITAMQEGIQRMGSILGVLKQAAKIEEKGVAYRPSWVYLDDLIRQVRLECDVSLERRKQTIDLAFSGDMHVWADAKLLANVILELLHNAINYSPAGAAIAVDAERRRDIVRLRVRDHGCGIPRQDIPRLFEKFVRGSNARKFRPNGNGLGLFIVKGIVAAAGGHVWVESEEGKGATVTVELPAEPDGNERGMQILQ